MCSNDSFKLLSIFKGLKIKNVPNYSFLQKSKIYLLVIEENMLKLFILSLSSLILIKLKDRIILLTPHRTYKCNIKNK